MEPKLRDRFVTRARHLKANRSFKEAIERDRATWDERFPAYRIGRAGYPPEEVAEGPDRFVVVYPPLLARAVVRLDAHLTPATWGPDDRATATARQEWWRLVRRLADAWWPEVYFPWRTFHGGHPADPFVSACLVWRTTVVSEEWVARDRALTVSLMPPEVDRASSGDLSFWSTLGKTLDAALADATSTGGSVTADQVTAMRIAALSAARGARAAVHDSDPRTWMPYVRLVPDMTSTDWRGLEQQVLAVLRAQYGGHFVHVHSHVHRLHAEGRSKSSIAGELGLSERQVSRILEDTKED